MMRLSKTPNHAASAVLTEAMDWIDTPYRHQGSRKGVGCDCLGLVRGVWRVVYGTEPEKPAPYTADWAETCGTDMLLEAARRHCVEKEMAQAQPGDLLVFRWRAHDAAKHLGILASADTFIHAYEGHAVTVSALIPQWRRRIVGIFEFPPLN